MGGGVGNFHHGRLVLAALRGGRTSETPSTLHFSLSTTMMLE